MQKLIFIIVFIPFIISGCSEEKSEKKLPVRNERPQKELTTEIHYLRLDSLVAKHIPTLDSLFDVTPYYANVDGKLLFYVGKGKYKYPVNGKLDNDSIVFGIINESYDTLLKPIYSKLYNPDATAPGYIEIEYHGKKGLFNYSNGQVIEPEYDLIFPSNKPEYLAVGKKGDDHFGIKSDMKVKISDSIPTYIELAQKFDFDIKSSKFPYLYDSYNSDDGPSEGKQIIITPSYVFNLGFIPEILDGIGDEKKIDFGLTKSVGKIEKTVTVTDKIYAFITSYFEEGVDARGWMINENNLITVDSKNNVISNEQILKAYSASRPFCGNITDGFNFINDTLLEVHEYYNSKDDYTRYDYMTHYFYYSIGSDGKIIKLESPRFFDFTKFIVLNENHFTGCFAKFRDFNNASIGEEEEGNVWLFEHLTLEDLDIMRNEIYAEYGLKFKTEKWNNYFRTQKWYQPKYDNVDQFLSETDKLNIKLILSVKQKMMGKENEITKKRLEKYAAWG